MKHPYQLTVANALALAAENTITPHLIRFLPRGPHHRDDLRVRPATDFPEAV